MPTEYSIRVQEDNASERSQNGNVYDKQKSKRENIFGRQKGL